MSRYRSPALSGVVLGGLVGCLVGGLGGCGGGSAGAAPPTTVAARLEVSTVEIGPGATSGELLVRLAQLPSTAPALLQVDIELPPELTLPAQDRLLSAAPLVTLDGDRVDDRFVVICGDAQNANAQPLAAGPLFRLRLLPSSPRQPGSYGVTLRNTRVAGADGAALAVSSEPVVATVIVR